jgi:hypothetical protein
MKITDLINILNEHLSCYGDREVFYLDGNKVYPITYLGSGSSDFGDYFWLTSMDALEGVNGEYLEEFKAPHYKPDLKIVK